MKKIFIVTALLASSCHNLGIREARDLSCRPEIPEQSNPATPNEWRRATWDVNTKGTYLKRSPQDFDSSDTDPDKMTPRALDLGPQLHVLAGDYIGLQAVGRFYYRRQNGAGSETGNQLVAVFVDAQGNFIAPAKSDQVQDYKTRPTYFGGEKTDIDQDFFVPAEQEMIVRVPAGAVKLKFTVDDSAFNDNGPVDKFGVTVFESNRKSAEPAGNAAAPASDDEELENVLEPELVRKILAGPLPEATSFAPDPFSSVQSAETPLQWRGNYKLSGWKPERSLYAGARTDDRHWGWDIFSPKGTPLIAPVWPAQMTTANWPPKLVNNKLRSNYGNIAMFAFKYKGGKYILIYGHLDRIQGAASRLIMGPEIVGYSGCSGLTPDDAIGCGSHFEAGKAKGMRNDHVHVGLWDSSAPKVGDASACDPAYLLNWRIQ